MRFFRASRGPAPTLIVTAVVAIACISTSALAELPNRSWDPGQLHEVVSPQMGAEDHNQPSVAAGHLLLAGNGIFELWDIEDPTDPSRLSRFASEHNIDEAESHTISFAKAGDGSLYVVSISGRGVDLWDITDPGVPAHLAHVFLEGIDYGDNSNAVWGVFWQGRYIYVGGTNTGVHVIDAVDPRSPAVVARVPTSEFGGVSAGPLWALGNLLVVTTPKNHAGVATLDIGDPTAPTLLDVEVPEEESYIGGFFGAYAYLLTPLRTYDVTTDPSNIQLIGSTETDNSEYVSFADGTLYLGSLRPAPGVFEYDISDPTEAVNLGLIEGRRPEGVIGLFVDDQFSIPIGNLLVLSDDEIDIGSALVVRQPSRDTQPPSVVYVNPRDGAIRQPLTTRVALSFDDQIDLRSASVDTFIVRPLGGDPITGMWGHMQTVLTFSPDEPLLTNTTYEIVVPAGGITDPVGNAVASEFRSTFSTGDAVAPLTCTIVSPTPVEQGQTTVLEAEDAGNDITYTWTVGEQELDGPSVEASWAAPGRYSVVLRVADGTGASRTCGATQIVHEPLAPLAPDVSSGVVVRGGFAWVTNPDAATVTQVDLELLEAITEVPVGAGATHVTRVADHIWVSNTEDDTITVVEPESATPERTISLPWGSAPSGMVVSSDNSTVWIVLAGSGAVGRASSSPPHDVDILSLPRAAPELAPQVRAIARTNGDDFVLPQFISPEGEGTVWLIDGQDDDITTVNLAPTVEPDAADGGRGVPNYLGGLAASRGNTTNAVWLFGKKDNTARGAWRDGLPLNTTNTVRTIAVRLDTAGEPAERAELRIDLDDHNMAFSGAVSPRGDLVFVASLGTHQVDVFDVESGRRIAGAATGLGPDGIALTDDGRLLVRNTLDRTLSVLDVGGVLEGTDAAITRLAEIPTVSEEPLDPVVLRGKRLFHNADSRRLSQDGYISCATCHFDGGQDGRIWDFTDRGEGLRNTIDLRGRAGTEHGPVHWTANFDEIHDFENDIRNAFGGSGLMSDDDFLASEDPLGPPKAGVSDDLDALAAYVASFDTYPKSPWRNPDGTMTDAALRGLELFKTLDCATCHAGTHLTDSGEPGEDGQPIRHDVGTITEASGTRRGEPLTGIDTPTLHGVWATAPYFHDGSAATLADTLAHPGHGNAQNLPPDDVADLVALLLQLEGDELDLEPNTPGEDTGSPDVGGAPPDAADLDGGLPDGGDPTNAGNGSSHDGCGCNLAQTAPSPSQTVLVVVLLAFALYRRRR